MIPQNAAQRGCGVRALRDQARVQEQAFVLCEHAPAQAIRTHADQIEQVMSEWVWLMTPEDCQFIQNRRMVLFPCAIKQRHKTMIEEIEELRRCIVFGCLAR